MAPLTAKQHRYARLVIVPVAASIASHLVFYKHYPYEIDYRFPWPYFLTVATVMLCCWETNLAIFRYLDQHTPFSKNPGKRIRQQILLGGSLTLLTFSVVFPLAIRVYSGNWPSMPLVTSGIFVCITIATLVNGGYVGLYLLQTISLEKRQNIANSQPKLIPPTQLSADLLIDAGTRQIRLMPSEIAYFYSTGGVVLLVQTNGQQLTTNYNSFASLENQLLTAGFFQLNRQFIVAMHAIRQVQDDSNQKLLVELMPALHKNQTGEQVTVSRYRRADFKKWFRQTVPI